MPPPTEPIDHTGWQLHMAARAWNRAFAQAMVARGFAAFAEPRAALLPLIGRQGVAQADLAPLAGLTKQAVQQHLDRLCAEGLVMREDDGRDGRRRRVVFTPEGLRMLSVADEVKRAIDAALARSLGAERLTALQGALHRLPDIVNSLDESAAGR